MPEPTLPLPQVSALDPLTQAFPKLTPAQIDRARPYGKLRQVAVGEIVFNVGDTGIPMFILLSGKMEIVQPTVDGERPVTKTDAGQFTGEINMISGRSSLVCGRVTEAGEFLEISPENLRSLIAKDAELSEVFMRAFILRRLALITKGFGDVILLGSRHCAGTLRLREFLSRNGHPYTTLISTRTATRRNSSIDFTSA
jgi:thioredoxin reductase (NADPH)